MNQILTKSIRLTKEDAVSLADIVEKDPRVERGSSEALRICYEDAAANIPNWKEILEESRHLDYSGRDADDSKELSTISFLVGEKEFMAVLESVRSQMELSRPRISYITRLCIYAARLKLYQKQHERQKVCDSGRRTDESVNGDVHKSGDQDAACPHHMAISDGAVYGKSASFDKQLGAFKQLETIDEKLDAIYEKLLLLENGRCGS